MIRRSQKMPIMIIMNAIEIIFIPAGSVINNAKYEGVVTIMPTNSTNGINARIHADILPSAESVRTLL